MIVQAPPITVEAFEEWIYLPENVDRDWEYIGGEIVEVVSSSYPSMVAGLFLVEIGLFNKLHNLGWVTGADGGYRVAGERYISDVAFISKARQPELPNVSYNPLPPDLAVEVLSPTNQSEPMRIKIANYLLDGVLVWLVDTAHQTVEVYTPGERVRKLGINDRLDGGSVLPGFSLAIKDVFPG